MHGLRDHWQLSVGDGRSQTALRRARRVKRRFALVILAMVVTSIATATAWGANRCG